MSSASRRCAPFLLFALAIPGTLLAQDAAKQSSPQKPIEVSDEEVASHRIGNLQPVPLHLVGGPSRLRLHGQGFPIPLVVVVAPDGSVLSATPSDEINFDNADSDVPKQWITELKKVIAQAQAEVRSLRYLPFERNGHAVSATFEEDVPCAPPEMLPGPHVSFPDVHNWNSLRMSLERTGCFGPCPSYSIEVHGDGTVLYNGDAFVAVMGQHRGEISQQALLNMLDAFRAADYFSLHGKYRSAVTDNPTYTTSIQFDGHSKKVIDYVGRDVGMPAAVTKLEDTIDELADSARWTLGDAATVQSLQEEHWDFTSPDAADTLARVAMYGSADAVRDLIAAGVPLNGHDVMGVSPIARAGFRGDLTMLRSILQAESETGPASLSSALSAAAAAGNFDAVKFLLQGGANPDAHPSQGDPPVVAAASSGIPAVLEEILIHHPDISARGHQGRTALLATLDANAWEDNGKPQIDRFEVVHLLLAAGAKVDARDDKGNTPLIDNAFDPRIAHVLLQHGADINATNNEAWTPLFSASSPELVRFLLLHGANLNVRDKDGETPLEAARHYGNQEIIALLEAAEAGKIK